MTQLFLSSLFTNEETKEQKVIRLKELRFTLWHLPEDTMRSASTPSWLPDTRLTNRKSVLLNFVN